MDMWIEFWKEIIKKIAKTNFFDTSILLNMYINKMRKVIPDFGLLNEELDIKKADTETDRYMAAYQFWLSLSRYIILPFSLYFNLLAPTFTERQNFPQDVEDLLNGYSEDVFPLLCPCTFLSLTPFGKMVFENI